ncbi:DUF4870 family protein [Thalassotalea aquiviva]|uniref:DUF4870 family protein n=1 Tax=Thalassotalea aquiviva TaxID=3242415 RepID=UPI00352AE381
MSDVAERAEPTIGAAKLVYVLYVAGLFFGITGLVGVIIAYINKSEAPEWLKSHYQFQIRTFWIGAVFMIVATLLTLVLIGWLLWLFWIIWLVVRCVKGYQALDADLPVANVKTWMF